MQSKSRSVLLSKLAAEILEETKSRPYSLPGKNRTHREDRTVTLYTEDDAEAVLADTNMSSPIQNFYKDQTVFITGATGFLGSLLVEKLLRCCPQIRKIILLVRSKGTKTIEERLREYFSDEIFDRMRLSNPNYWNKVDVTCGQMDEEDFGLVEDDLQRLLANTTVVFHIAATVRFDAHIRVAYEINVKGTQTALSLAKRMPRLKSFVHVSTAYCNCDRAHIEEIFYPPTFTSDELATMMDSSTDEELSLLTEHLLASKPNTYTLTKSTAEDLVRESVAEIPVCVFRPSIVFPTLEEPMPLWMKGFNAVLAVFFAMGTGLYRVHLCKSNLNIDIVPADRTVNAMAALPWYTTSRGKCQTQPVGWRTELKSNERSESTRARGQTETAGICQRKQSNHPSHVSGTELQSNERSNNECSKAKGQTEPTGICQIEQNPSLVRNSERELQSPLQSHLKLSHIELGSIADQTVFNFVSYNDNRATITDLMDSASASFISSEESSPSVLWMYNHSVTDSPRLYYFLFCILHILPAVVFSLGERIYNKKPRVMNFYRKVTSLLKAITYFNVNEWSFENSNTRSLITAMSPSDRSGFDADVSNFRWESVWSVTHRTISWYMLRERMTKENYRRKLVYIVWVDWCIGLGFRAVAVYWLLGFVAGMINTLMS